MIILFALMIPLLGCSTSIGGKKCTPTPANMTAPVRETLSPSPNGTRNALIETGTTNDEEYGICYTRYNALIDFNLSERN